MNTLSPQFIPHTQFHTGIWLLPLEGSGWYYFSEGDNKNHITNENFMESVDEPLKELVSFLHEKNIRTTPSCSGHSYDKNYFEAIYSDLKKDEKEIQTKGLLLKDIERGSIHFYKDKHYTLPWERNQFLDLALRYQTKGVLGLRLEQEKEIKERLLELQIPGVLIEEKDEIVFINTENGGLMNKWEEITGVIKNIFEVEEKAKNYVPMWLKKYLNT